MWVHKTGFIKAGFIKAEGVEAMKFKTILMLGMYAAITAAGIGASSAQAVPDYRCQSCQWNMQACFNRCDINDPDNGQCYGICVQRRNACVATFCN